MSARTIALQLRTLAADPASQALLLQETSCLTGLVSLLSPDNEEDVLLLSLQALAFLAAPVAHHATLVHQPGLVLAVTLLTEKQSIAIKTLAQNVLTSLEGYINGGANGPATSRRVSGISRSTSRGSTRPGTPSAASSHSTGVLGVTTAATPRYLNHVAFQINHPHMTGSSASDGSIASQQEIERALVAIKGVISVTYSSNGGKDKATFTLYTSLRPTMLLPLVSKALVDVRGGNVGGGFTVQMMSKDKANAESADKENQENANRNVNSAAPAYLNKPNAGPSYLKPKATATSASSASSSSSSGPSYLNSNSNVSTGASSRALTTHATATSSSDSVQSLAARYQAQAKKHAATASAGGQTDAKKSGGGGLLSSVASFFW